MFLLKDSLISNPTCSEKDNFEPWDPLTKVQKPETNSTSVKLKFENLPESRNFFKLAQAFHLIFFPKSFTPFTQPHYLAIELLKTRQTTPPISIHPNRS